MKLYVSIIPIAQNDLSSLLIKHVERKLIWKYAQQYGKLPLCNSM